MLMMKIQCGGDIVESISKKKVGIKDLFPYKSYLVVLMANFISRFGDSVDSIAYSWMVYAMTGSKVLLGSIFAVNAIPNIVFGPFTGVLVDYFSKKKLIIIGDIGRGIIVSIVGVMFLFNWLEPWHLFVFTFITSTFESIVNPSKTSLLPILLPKELYTNASSFSDSLLSMAQLFGYGISGFLIGTIGITGALIVDGITFFASCILIAQINIKSIKKNKKEKFDIKTYFNNLKKGFKFVIGENIIVVGIVLFALTNLFLTPISVLSVAYIRDVLFAGPKVFGLVSIALPAGMIMGGLVFAQIGYKFKKSSSIIGGLVIMGMSYSVLGLIGFVNIPLISPVIIAFIVFLMFGIVMPAITAPLKTHVFTNTPKEMLGRVIGVLSMVTTSAMPLGGAISGALSEKMSIQSLYLTMGLVMMIFPFAALLNKDFRKA
ncbi:MAG: MFS transporter [Firmicutes bacterium]|nr:MFS transporter [Bacillota bacterium]